MLLERATGLLLAKRREILDRRGELPIIEQYADAIDQAIATETTRRTALERDRDSRRLKEISIALEAIATGEYGLCVDCDQKISQHRLDAVPWAVRCVRCQEHKDLEQEVA